LEECNRPAGHANLRLFQSAPQTNLLVVYEEFSERNESVRTRAYWLNENQALLDQGLPPNFVSPDSMRGRTAIPVYYEPLPAGAVLPSALCAVVATNKQSFTMYLQNRAVAQRGLPVYNDGKAKIERAAMTPVAVAADLTIVGGFLGCWYLEGFADTPFPLYTSNK
jgi:hypothetical protein